MKTSTTIRSWGALLLGVFFTAVTARTIFDDVWNGADVTVAHINAAAALVAAIAAGHMCWPALRQGRLPAALGLALIFVASTGYIVTSAGARNAEVAQAKAAAIFETNAERVRLEKQLSEAETDLADAKREAKAAADAAAKECSSGKKSKCDGRAETRDWRAKDVEKAQSHAQMLAGKIAYLGPIHKPFEGYAHAAKVFEAAGLGASAVIEARLTLLMPFALVLISELGTLVFLGMALGHRAIKTIAAKVEPANDTAPTFAEVKAATIAGERLPVPAGFPAIETFSGDLPEPPRPPNGGRKSKKTSTAEVIQFPAKHPAIEALEKNGGSVASNRKLAELMGVSDGEASKRWQEIEHLLHVQKVGKELRIALKARA